MTASPDSSLFTFPQEANYWNELYEAPSGYFEHAMKKRLDYAWRYVTGRFDTGARVLDLGCGAGVLAEKLIGSGFAVTAADASEDMLTLARERLRNSPAGSCRLVHANCLNLPFGAGDFDLVVCMGVFGYFDEASQALREIRRVLRPGGILFMSVRNAHTRHVFDLAQLAVLPARLLVRRFGKAARSAGPSFAAAATRHPWEDDGFRIRIHQNPAALIAGVVRQGYALKEFDGLGYGPLTLGGTKLLPGRISVALSEMLEKAFRATGFNRASRWIADVSFYTFQRDDRPEGRA